MPRYYYHLLSTVQYTLCWCRVPGPFSQAPLEDYPREPIPSLCHHPCLLPLFRWSPGRRCAIAVELPLSSSWLGDRRKKKQIPMRLGQPLRYSWPLFALSPNGKGEAPEGMLCPISGIGCLATAALLPLPFRLLSPLFRWSPRRGSAIAAEPTLSCSWLGARREKRQSQCGLQVPDEL